jgi:hypothetical protein
MAIVTLVKKGVRGGRIIGGVHFKRNVPVNDLDANFAVSFAGSDSFEVQLSASEVRGLSDRKLKHLPRLLGVSSIKEAKKVLNPDSIKKKSLSSKVKSTVEKALPLKEEEDTSENTEE